MIYFLAAVLFSSCIVILFKLIDRYQINLLQAIVVNYIVAGGYGWMLNGTYLTDSGFATQDWFPYSIGSGILFILVFVMFGLSTRQAGIAMTSVSSKMSVILPVVMGFALLGEPVGGMRIAGIVLALLAFCLTFRKKEGNGFKNGFKLFPVLLFFSSGLSDSLMKYAQVTAMGNDKSAYLTIVFTLCLLLGVLLLFFRQGINGFRIQWKVWVAGGILGLFNWLSTLMLVKAMHSFDSSILFPLFNASIVSLAAVNGVVFFREKLRPVNWAGVVLAILAILMIAG